MATIHCFVTLILHNIFFCVQQKNKKKLNEKWCLGNYLKLDKFKCFYIFYFISVILFVYFISCIFCGF